MLENLKKKSIGSYVSLIAAILAVVMSIVYSTYAGTYALFNTGVLLCLLAVCALNVVLFVFETPFDEYLKVAAAVLAALATALFIVAFAGDISDYINGVSFLGRGAKLPHIITIAVFMVILIGLQIVSSCVHEKK